MLRFRVTGYRVKGVNELNPALPQYLGNLQSIYAASTKCNATWHHIRSLSRSSARVSFFGDSGPRYVPSTLTKPESRTLRILRGMIGAAPMKYSPSHLACVEAWG